MGYVNGGCDGPGIVVRLILWGATVFLELLIVFRLRGRSQDYKPLVEPTLKPLIGKGPYVHVAIHLMVQAKFVHVTVTRPITFVSPSGGHTAVAMGSHQLS